MKATAEHEKYVNDLTTLMDESGREMSNAVTKMFKIVLKASGNSTSFARNIKALKPAIKKALSKKATNAIAKSFRLGKNFATQKTKK